MLCNVVQCNVWSMPQHTEVFQSIPRSLNSSLTQFDSIRFDSIRFFLLFVSGKEFDLDCYGCLGAKGCHYCPGDGTCSNSNVYRHTLVSACVDVNDYRSSSLFFGQATSCIPETAYSNDPLYEGNSWMYDMINVVGVWENHGFTGKRIRIRINDNGVNVDHPEFVDRFDTQLENSCKSYRPNQTNRDENNNHHGTAVAGIVVGNANNNVCAVGIAHEATFTSCNFFRGESPSKLLAHKIEAFDISQNSIGVP